MKVIICGAGQVGTSIARHLISEGNDVIVIDQSEERIRKINETLDAQAFFGFASHPSMLESVGAKEADMLIAVTISDEVNMLACQVAHSLFNIPIKIARIRHQNYLNPEWNGLYQTAHLPIDVIISPEQEVAKAIIHRLHVPGSLDTIPLVDSRLKVIGFRCNDRFSAYRTPLNIIKNELNKICANLLGIFRNGEIIPIDENNEFRDGDEVFFVSETKQVSTIMSLFGYEDKEARKIIIIGGGNIGLFLSQELENENDVSIKLIEVSKERAEFVAESLNKTSVINGSALENEILLEANANIADTIISVTNDDQVNILSALLAKKLGCKKAVSLINNSNSYSPLISSLGIDIGVNPRETTVSSILQYMRRGKVLHAHPICEGRAEIIEAEAVESSTLTGKTIENLNFPDGINIGMIVRGNEIITPNPSSIIKAGDRVITLCKQGLIKKVEKAFSVKFDYF